jgi:hypothetical protein
MSNFYLHPAGQAVVYERVGGYHAPSPAFTKLTCAAGTHYLNALVLKGQYTGIKCWMAVYTNPKGRSTIIPRICVDDSEREAWAWLIRNTQGCALRNIPIFMGNTDGLAAADAHAAHIRSLLTLIVAARRQRVLWLSIDLYRFVHDEFILL